ncbi:phytoene desaturase family protein [Naumannella halotolerans]|uniref:Phytoene desaturase n=1 Tax=Naumannella halotolerans TaxID=993414 RepID=A0A4R7JBQ0_9ACTN|nr:phytoene desaturase family protein [Naumannella halotolerans]TDT34416.1 phytoene desaturase [Naumannella halotolerans]
MSHVVIIGSGLAGLSAACHLLGAGHRVSIVERDHQLGGRARRVSQDGFTFDLGPTVMTMPELLDEPLRAIGSSQQRAVPMRRLDPGYRGRFADGSELLIRDSTPRTAAEIAALAGSAEGEAFSELAQFLHRLNTIELLNFIDRNFDSPLDLLRNPVAVARLVSMGAFGSLQRMIDKRISDPRVRRMLTFQALYAGLRPDKALGVYGVITYMDTVRGVYLPEGGMGAVAAGLAAELADKATIITDTTVTELLRRSDGVIAGVNTTGGTIAADAVVITTDLPEAYRRLLPELQPPRAVRRPVYSPSAVVWHLGVRGELPQRAAHHNIHFGEQWAESFEALVDRGVCMPDPSRLVTVSSLGEPGLAPDGAHTLYVLEPVPGTGRGVDWTRERGPIRERLAEFLAANDYPTDIVTERLVTPTEWEAEGLAGGTPFGLAHVFSQTGPFRPSNLEPRVPGVFFAGSSTVPGVGVPMVLISGKLVSHRVDRWFGRRR